MRRRQLILCLLTLLLVLAGAGSALGKGAQPGTFTFKVHAPIGLEEREFEGSYQWVQRTGPLLDAPVTAQAGAHADATWSWVVTVPGGTSAVLNETEVPANVATTTPPGVFTGLDSVPACSAAAFNRTVRGELTKGCGPESQVGLVSFYFGGAVLASSWPVYKLTPQPGDVATFGYPYELLWRVGSIIHARLRTEGDYGLTLARTKTKWLSFTPASFMTFWAVPASPSHNSERWNPATGNWGATVEGPLTPLVSNPSGCGAGPLESRLEMSYRFEEKNILPEEAEDPSYRYSSPAPSGCSALSFEPRAEMATTTTATDAPSGLELALKVPPDRDPEGLETPALKDATFSLPGGLSLNPAAAVGLEGCAPGQIGLLGAEGPLGPSFDARPAQCPQASRLGSVELESPLFEEPLEGDVYLATPGPGSGSSPGLYLVLHGSEPPSSLLLREGEAPELEQFRREEEEEREAEGRPPREKEEEVVEGLGGREGPPAPVTIKLAARTEVDPATGRITAKLESLPQLPIEALRVNLAGGSAGPFVTPAGCGQVDGEVIVTPWSAPQSGPPARRRSAFDFAAGPGGASCPRSARPFKAALGVSNGPERAGGPTSLALDFSRPEGDQDLAAISVTLPRGMSADTVGVGVCGPVEIAAAEALGHSGGGTAEGAAPSCPSASRVGSVTSKLGAGPNPLRVGGEVYLAGPYEGAPSSLVAITPALAGGSAAAPLFDFGTVVERIPLRVDRRSGQLTAGPTELPLTLAGVQLHIDSVRLALDRPGFLRAPSGCRELRFAASVEGGEGGRSSPTQAYRASGCRNLKFRPSASLRLSGTGTPGGHPGLATTVRLGPGDAAIAAAQITLPPALVLNPAAMPVPCGPKTCRLGPQVGRAVLDSPLLKGRLSGPAYLRSSAAGPQLVLVLGGRSPLELVGSVREVDGRLQVAFAGLPDLPLRRLRLTLRGGRKGALENGESRCVPGGALGRAHFSGYGGKVERLRLPVAGGCGGAAAGGAQGRGAG